MAGFGPSPGLARCGTAGQSLGHGTGWCGSACLLGGEWQGLARAVSWAGRGLDRTGVSVRHGLAGHGQDRRRGSDGLGTSAWDGSAWCGKSAGLGTVGLVRSERQGRVRKVGSIWSGLARHVIRFGQGGSGPSFGPVWVGLNGSGWACHSVRSVGQGTECHSVRRGVARLVIGFPLWKPDRTSHSPGCGPPLSRDSGHAREPCRGLPYRSARRSAPAA